MSGQAPCLPPELRKVSVLCQARRMIQHPAGPQAVPGPTGRRRQAAFALLGLAAEWRDASGRSNGVVSCFRRWGTGLAQDQVRELAQLPVRVGRAEALFDVE